MSEWRTIHLTQARQVAALMGLTEELPAPEISVRAYYTQLRDREPAEALAFIAHALPRFDAIAWASGTVADSLVQEAEALPERHAVLIAVGRWSDEQDDRERRAAYIAGQSLHRDMPERSLASAVFYSGGSIAPEGSTPVLPAPGLANRFAAISIIQAAYRCADARAFIANALARAEVVAENGTTHGLPGRRAA